VHMIVSPQTQLLTFRLLAIPRPFLKPRLPAKTAETNCAISP
jgi:hypothetical protein